MTTFKTHEIEQIKQLIIENRCKCCTCGTAPVPEVREEWKERRGYYDDVPEYEPPTVRPEYISTGYGRRERTDKLHPYDCRCGGKFKCPYN